MFNGRQIPALSINPIDIGCSRLTVASETLEGMIFQDYSANMQSGALHQIFGELLPKNIPYNVSLAAVVKNLLQVHSNHINNDS